MSEKQIANLSIYRVTNTETGDRRWTVAVFAEEACKALDWPEADCHVVRLDAKRHTRPDGVKGLMVAVPCLVCPYQYAECQKPPQEPCPTRSNAPDLKEWLAQVTAAHLCNHVGQPIFKGDYESCLMWLTLPAAIDYVNLQPH